MIREASVAPARGTKISRDSQASLRPRLHARAGDRRIRPVEAPPRRSLGRPSAREEEPYTSVVIPSLTLDQSELTKLEAASFYEERLLFPLIRLRNPQARMVYVTSQPVHSLILEYYFQLLAGIPASHARARLTLLCAHDASPRSLTEKISNGRG